jgi:hypothetical protein
MKDRKVEIRIHSGNKKRLSETLLPQSIEKDQYCFFVNRQSDFILFGHVKYCLQETTFRSRQELFEVMSQIVTAIPPEALHDVLEHWIERLERVSQNTGDYNPKAKQELIQFFVMIIWE